MLPLFAAAIISTTMSNSSTGGNVVQGGNVVNGSSYSSVSVETYDNGSGATSTVNIETDDNGEVNEQTITKTAPAGGTIEINAATSTGNARVAVHVGPSGSSTPLFGTTTPFSKIATASGFTAYFNGLFSHLFNLFHFW